MAPWSNIAQWNIHFRELVDSGRLANVPEIASLSFHKFDRDQLPAKIAFADLFRYRYNLSYSYVSSEKKRSSRLWIYNEVETDQAPVPRAWWYTEWRRAVSSQSYAVETRQFIMYLVPWRTEREEEERWGGEKRKQEEGNRSWKGRKNTESWEERRTKKEWTRKGRDEERSGNRKKRGMVAGSTPLHALDASIFFANNVRVNYPHRYQSDEGGSRLRRCCLVWWKRDQPLSRASQKIEFTKIPSRSRRLLPRQPANVTRTIPAFPVPRSEILRCFNPYSRI